MAEEGFKRKLTAILSADVEGYSRLMGDDEEATVRTLTSYREVLSTLIQQHNGKVLDSPGDNLLAEFASVVDAVQCAVAVQKEIHTRNEELPENRRMQFRIGINLGDVIQEEGRIYGDGVNIAARLEGLAEPGGICISKTAFDHIESKLPYGYDFIGEQTVKNIAKPVGAYRVLLDPRVTVSGKPVDKKLSLIRRTPILVGAVVALVLALAVGVWQFYLRRPIVEPASVEKMAFPLPDKPSLAVLPFENISGDPEQSHIADGITENLIMSLSKIPEIFVIARNSVFTYKGKLMKAQKISEELGVRYILEGSVQTDQENIRINAQLVDAINGSPLWSEQYDRRLEKLFDLQDDITHNIMVALQVQLTDGEQAILRYRSTNSIKAWSYAVRAYSLSERYNKEDNEKAQQLLGKAIELDPDYAWAWTWLATTQWIAARFGFSESSEKSFKLSAETARKAMALNDSDPDLHALMASIYLSQRQYDQAVAEGENAITFGPNNAEAHSLFAQVQFYNGKFEEAIQLCQKAIRLHPHYPAWYLVFMGHSYRMLYRYDEALEIFNEILSLGQKGQCPLWWGYFYLAETYSEMGMESEARAQVEKLLEVKPDASIEVFKKMTFFKNSEHLERRIHSWRKAGIPE